MFETVKNSLVFLVIECSPFSRLRALSFYGVGLLNAECIIKVLLTTDPISSNVTVLFSNKTFLAINASKVNIYQRSNFYLYLILIACIRILKHCTNLNL